MKTVFITGGASGIGLATARHFAQAGWFVGIYDINSDRIEELLRSTELPHACGQFCDVRDRQSIADALAHFSQQTNGRLDVLVNNAGVLTGGNFQDIDSSAHDAIMDINVKGVTHVAQLAFPLLKQTANATLVNLCSLSSVMGVPQLAVYSASKFYVNGLTEALNVEWAEHGIRVTCVKPPIVQTAMGDAVPARLLKRMAVELAPEQVAASIFDAVHGSNAGYLLGLKGSVLGLLARGTPWVLRRRLIAWVTSYD